MPIYEYICHGCGHTFEKLVSIEERDSVESPCCDNHDGHAFADRILSAPSGFILKGDGFYKPSTTENN